MIKWLWDAYVIVFSDMCVVCDQQCDECAFIWNDVAQNDVFLLTEEGCGTFI